MNSNLLVSSNTHKQTVIEDTDSKNVLLLRRINTETLTHRGVYTLWSSVMVLFEVKQLSLHMKPYV